MNTEYTRIIPRDLFNEAKLLKCIGRLCLLIHDGMAPKGLKFEETGEPFQIGQHQDDGSLGIANLNITIKKKELTFKTAYNSKDNYPLYLEHEYEQYEVFNENGEFRTEFIEFCKSVK